MPLEAILLPIRVPWGQAKRLAELNTIGNQRVEIGRIGAEAARRAAVALNVRRLVIMMWEGFGQVGVFGVRLRIIPADFLLASIDGVAVPANQASVQVNRLCDAQS